ncbi:MAG: transposase [Lentimonas sp.]|jgi:transposase
MRRGDCAAGGVKVEKVPWAQGKHSCCDVFRHFLASWAKRISWKETAECFHVIKKLGEVVDQVRRDESKRLHRDGYEPVLKNSRYCFLKRPDNLNDKQNLKRNEVLQYDLKTARAYYLKESFDAFRHYNSPQ